MAGERSTGGGALNLRSRLPSVASRSERLQAGKSLRRRLRRSAQGIWSPGKDRPSPVDILVEGDRGRLPALLPIRYGRMAASPFGFLRGAAGVMAHDLAGTASTGLRVQMLGDAHVSNFGLFATPERDQVFDANDFDETIPGPWEWDLKRLATSVVLVGRANRFDAGAVRSATEASVASYRRRMRTYASESYLDAWYTHLDLAEASREVGRRARRLLRRELPVAAERTGYHAFPKLARRRGRSARIRDAPPLLQHYRERTLSAEVHQAFRRYRAALPPERRPLYDRYELVDVAQKVVGVGSVGTRCAIGLFLGDRDLPEPLFLQVKEASVSVHERFVGTSAFANHAERVVVGQRLVQEASDIFLGWSSAAGHDFYVRQLRDMKFASDLSSLGPRQFLGQAELCGAALARAHARTGDPAAIAGYVGAGRAFDLAIGTFAERYARQTEDDHAQFVRAVRAGRLPAEVVTAPARR